MKIPAKCLNPNQNIGQCISIYDCVSLSHVVRNELEAQYRFVRLSQCAGGDGKTPFVCCTNDTDFNQPNGVEKKRVVFPDMITTERTGSERPKVAVAFIEPPLCGALAISNKIYGGEDADVNEFTWLVKLEYKAEDGSILSECAGSLINERYVLTAAHCVTGTIEEQIGKLVYLRVGDHRFSTSEPCNEEDREPYGYCVGIESVVVHENYGANRDIRIREQNDIALIRMNRSVKFDEHIQPVCLPTASLQKELIEGELLTAVGWGHTGFSRHSSVKQKVNLPLYSLQHCRHIFQKYFYVAAEQLCAGGVFRQDSCTGDSGGPLMRLYSASWIIEGIVSFGRRGCGHENRPGVYTRVRNYIDWIAEHMEAW
ncbi:unnamed protein product [Ceratitis capitata]|uniref:CLIP domain-containing serine protease n=1 Tax=Ceratitis capitata TaxID=7213 RepID=A0A811U1I8_CERCA|nr:unnamed protein product [Ceratitis capitata]